MVNEICSSVIMKVAVLSFVLAKAAAAGILERQASQTCDINNCLIEVGGLASESVEIVAAQSSCISNLVSITTLPCM